MSISSQLRYRRSDTLESQTPSETVFAARPPRAVPRPGMLLLGMLALGMVMAPELWAGGAGTTMPWNTPIQTLLNNMTGPTARALVGIATAFSGYKWMFQSHEQGANSMARVTVGGAIALTAQTIISYASFGGALL